MFAKKEVKVSVSQNCETCKFWDVDTAMDSTLSKWKESDGTSHFSGYAQCRRRSPVHIKSMVVDEIIPFAARFYDEQNNARERLENRIERIVEDRDKAQDILSNGETHSKQKYSYWDARLKSAEQALEEAMKERHDPRFSKEPRLEMGFWPYTYYGDWCGDWELREP